MLIIPFVLPPGAPRGPVVVVLILEKENLDRMKEADPFDMKFREYRGHMPVDRPIGDLDLVIAYEEDAEKIVEFKKRDNIVGLLIWLQRGRQIKPHDLHPPISMTKTSKTQD